MHANQRGPRLTENVLCQREGHSLFDMLASAPRIRPDKRPFDLLHVVNLYETANADERATQEATTASMRAAADAANSHLGKTRLMQIQSTGSSDLTPPGFERGPDLHRTVQDVGDFQLTRSLPLLFDILDAGTGVGELDDFLIYTNADICLQPQFYDAVRTLLSWGFDSITINRRTIPVEAIQLPKSLGQSEIGTYHSGFDCFLFPLSMYRRFIKSTVCLGVGGVARPLLYNLVAYSESMLMLKHVTLTYHFGNDRPWRDPKYADYVNHNRTEYLRVVRALGQNEDTGPRLRDFCFKHPEPEPAREVFRHLQ